MMLYERLNCDAIFTKIHQEKTRNNFTDILGVFVFVWFLFIYFFCKQTNKKKQAAEVLHFRGCAEYSDGFPKNNRSSNQSLNYSKGLIFLKEIARNL